MPFASPDDAVHPRKRKIKMKEPETEPPMVSLVDQPISNCYETFLKIRKQVNFFFFLLLLLAIVIL